MTRPRNTVIISATLALLIAVCPVGAQDAEPSGDFNEAVSEFRAGNYASAVTLFDRVESVAPGATDAQLYKARALIHLNDYTAADATLRSYLQIHRKSSDALYLLGFVEHRENRPADSLATYTRAAAITPPTGDDLKVVGLDYVLLDDYADAIKWLAKAVEMDPANKDAWYYLGRAYYTRAQLPEAQKAFLAVLNFNPQDSKAENNLGLIFETSGQAAAAIDAYQKAIAWQENDPHPNAQPYVNLGNLLLEQGQLKEALPALEKAVGLAPQDAFCRMKLGVAYRQAERLDDARRELEKGAQLDPDNPAVHFQLGRLYKEMHALDRAQAEFNRTAELQSRASKPKGSPDH